MSERERYRSFIQAWVMIVVGLLMLATAVYGLFNDHTGFEVSVLSFMGGFMVWNGCNEPHEH